MNCYVCVYMYFLSWHKQQQVLNDSASNLNKLEKEWSDYNAIYENLLSRVDEYRKELGNLSDDRVPEIRRHNLLRAEV